MSLINDALKRAHKNRRTSPRTDPTNLEPAYYESNQSFPLIIIPIAFIVVIISGVWFVTKGIEMAGTVSVPEHTIVARETNQYLTQTLTVSVPPLPSAPTPPTNTDPFDPHPDSAHTDPVPVTLLPAPVPPKPEPVVPSFPDVKLQAVFYSARNPSVVINSKTLVEGQQFHDIKVISINRESVIIEWQGETRELYMP